MLITKRSILTGIEHTMDLPVTQEQLDEVAKSGDIQHILPHLSADEREFLITGITSDEWAKHIPDEDE